jgi:hypothetical protein
MVTSYAVLGWALLSTRLVGLDRSYSHDEILTIEDFVRGRAFPDPRGRLLPEQPRAL